MRNIKREIDSVCHKKLYSLITDNSFSDNYHFNETIRRPLVIIITNVLSLVRSDMHRLNKIIRYIWKI
jgi:hypothetical protein